MRQKDLEQEYRDKNVSFVGISIDQDKDKWLKMVDEKVISGSQFVINPKGTNYHTCAFVGLQVNLTHKTTHQEVFQAIKEIPEIVECHHITGKYSLLLKIYTHSNEHLKQILVEKIQSILEVTGTETFISLEEGFSRQLPVENA